MTQIETVVEFVAKHQGDKAPYTVATNINFDNETLPNELQNRLEEGAVVTFPAVEDFEDLVLEQDFYGNRSQSIYCVLRYADGKAVPFPWYPRTWMRAYRALDVKTGRTAATPTMWRGVAADFNALAREVGCTKAITDLLLGKSFKAFECQEVLTRYYDSVVPKRTFHMECVATDTEALAALAKVAEENRKKKAAAANPTA